MKYLLSFLLCSIMLWSNAGTIRYFPKGSSPEQIQGLTEFIPNVQARMAMIVGPGIGERNNGDLAGCQKSSGWPGWDNIKLNADKYGIILIFINTVNEYENGEYQFALCWIKRKYPELSNNIWLWGHSLGSFGAGKHAMKDTSFVAQIAGWIASGSGDFTYYITNQYQNLVKYGVKVWGVTAVNDVVSGTSPRPIRELYNQMKAIDPKAYVIKTEFPYTEWPTPAGASGSKTAHNAVLSRLSQVPPYYSSGDLSQITFGIASNSKLKMNIYEWMLANPKGSPFHDPTVALIKDSVITTPPPVPVPNPVPGGSDTSKIVNINYAIRSGFLVIQWNNGAQTIKPKAGDAILNVFDRVLQSGRVITIDYMIAPTVTIGPKRK